MKLIKFFLEWRSGPVYEYGEDGPGDILGEGLPPKYENDAELANLVDEIGRQVDALYFNGPHEFAFIGFETQEKKDAFKALVTHTLDVMEQKMGHEYIINRDVLKRIDTYELREELGR